MSVVAPSRLAALKQLQCAIFQTSYNPTSVRTGAKYLRARLRGPSMVQYYPKIVSLAKLARDPRRDFINVEEEQRLRDVEDKKKRGKGAPKKAKSKGALRSPDLLDEADRVVFVQTRVGGLPGSADRALAVSCGVLATVNPVLLHTTFAEALCSPRRVARSTLRTAILSARPQP